MTQAVEEHRVDFHRMLLRLSGRLPDELISTSRRWLAEGELVEIAQAVLFAALANRVEMTEDDVALLHVVLAAAGEDVEPLADLERTEDELVPPYGLAPVGPADLAEHGDAVPYCIDLTLPYEGPGAVDEVDRAAVAAVATGIDAIALWRVWRFPAVDAEGPPPRRIYLLQGDAEGALPALAAGIQQALEAAGETDPQVEAFLDPDDLPTFQRAAVGFSTLLWTAAPAEVPVVARLYDMPEDVFLPDHPRLDGEEREHVLGYLAGGTPLLMTTTLDNDVVDPEAGEVVPTGFLTDGRWVWVQAAEYYLRAYDLAPDPDLLEAIRANDYQPPEVDAVAVHRALSVLYTPAEPVLSA
ncbi:hypothetical protein AB0F59_32250 [Micromonospora lupini]|uniref:hypothetical protein n=1 Tax=Micromonospora lupini TaxID=285679 RepID=UPI0033C9CBD6